MHIAHIYSPHLHIFTSGTSLDNNLHNNINNNNNTNSTILLSYFTLFKQKSFKQKQFQWFIHCAEAILFVNELQDFIFHQRYKLFQFKPALLCCYVERNRVEKGTRA